MYQYKFIDGLDIEKLLLTSLEDDLLIPSSNPNEAIYFKNGDKMTIDIQARTLLWEPLCPGAMTTSKLSMRLHQWYGKGYIQKMN